ncbi:MAG: hypothetical protein Q8911_08560 [Bacillota bacterium]|nr:hypothetical protein [Bacillota bacterium]
MNQYKPINKDKATKMWENGCTDQEIAEELGLNKLSIANWRRRNGMGSNIGLFNWCENDKGKVIAW